MTFNGKFWHKPGHLGMTTAQVKEALANATEAAALPLNGDRTKIILSIPDADVLTILGGGNKTYYVSEDDFIKKDASVNEFPQTIALDVPAVNRVIFPVFNIKMSTSAFYSILFYYNGVMYYLWGEFSWSDVENKWEFDIHGETL